MQSVTTALTRLDGVSGVAVDLATGRVSYQSAGIPRERIEAAIRDAGFGPE